MPMAHSGLTQMGTDRPLAAIQRPLGRLIREISRDTDRDPPQPGQFPRPRPVLPRVAVLRHGQAPLLRTTRGGSKARGMLSGRYEKCFMYELIGQGTITNIRNNLAMAMYVTPCQVLSGLCMGYRIWGMGDGAPDIGHGPWAMGYRVRGYQLSGMRLWAVGCGLWALGYGLWAMGIGLSDIKY